MAKTRSPNKIELKNIIDVENREYSLREWLSKVTGAANKILKLPAVPSHQYNYHVASAVR